MLAAANFENETTVEETFDENLFIELTKKVTIWDYYAITKAHYLTLPEEETKGKISRYYSDMKTRKIGGKLFVSLFLCSFLFEKCLLKCQVC